MQSHTVRRITSAHAALSLHSLINSTPNRASIIFFIRWAGPSRSAASDTAIDSVSATAPSRRPFPMQARPASTTSPERSEDMHPSRPCLYLLCPRLALLLSLMLIAWLASCGPASSDNAPSLSHARTWPG